MARADVMTLLPLDSWARIMGVDPWEFNQVGEGVSTASGGACQEVWFQQPWQKNYMSREEVAGAIEEAEAMIARELGYWPAPKFISNESHQYPHPYEGVGYGGTPRGYWKAVRLTWGFVQGGGMRARTLIQAGAAVVRSDQDGDGVLETFTVTVATTVTDTDEIAVYFNTVDRNAAPLDESWRLRPLRVTISGGNATIVGNSWQLILPDLTTKANPVPLVATDAAIYATTVDVYRTYRDVTTTTADPAQGTALWESIGCDVPPCDSAWVPICLGARDTEIGLVLVDFWLAGANDLPAAYEPDRVTVNYVAGVPLVAGLVDPEFAKIIAYLATGLLPVEPCGCDRSEKIIDWWRSEPAGEHRQYTRKEIDECPFGQSRGGLWAWKRVLRLTQS